MAESGKGLSRQAHKAQDKSRKSVLVLGAGIAGATVGKCLSDAGCRVHLVDRLSSIGGRVADMGCKATQICLRCNICVANDLLRTVATRETIEVHTRTELVKLENGTNGSRYIATLKHEPTFIARDKCIGCRACVAVCPEKCIAAPKILLSPGVPVIDYKLCRLSSGKDCSKCEKACPTGAINMKEKGVQDVINADFVVVATGYEPYNPIVNASYGYGKATNVITGIEAEKQLADHHKLTRPSDGQPPKRVAFIQCVGSRSETIERHPEDTDYCSAVCCAYALRMARLLKYHSSECQVTVFYMDIQNFGKGFNQFYKQCRDNMTFIRSRPYEIKQGQGGCVRVKFAPQSPPENAASQVCEQEFDMVILAVGIRPAQDATMLAEALQVPLDEHGFFGLKGASPLPVLQRDGIFVAGACESPKDVQSCMRQAEAVSAAIISENKN